jgi:hypothetical protein
MPTVERDIDYTLPISPEVAKRGGRVVFVMQRGCPQCDSQSSVKTCPVCSKFVFGLKQSYTLGVDIRPNDRHGRVIEIPNIIGDRTVRVIIDISSEQTKRPKTDARATNNTPKTPSFQGLLKPKNLIFVGSLGVFAIYNGSAAYSIGLMLLSFMFLGWVFRMIGRVLNGISGGTSRSYASTGQSRMKKPVYCTKCGHDFSNFSTCHCRQQGLNTGWTDVNPNIGGTSSNKTGYTPPFHSNNYSMGSNVHPDDMAAASASSERYEQDLWNSGRGNEASAEAGHRAEAERNDRLNNEARQRDQADRDRQDKERRDREEEQRRQW